MSESNGHASVLNKPRIEQPPAPQASNFWQLVQTIWTAILSLLVAYMIFVAFPEAMTKLDSRSKTMDSALEAEASHSKRMEAMRNKEKVDLSLLLLDLREANRMVKTLRKGDE